MSEIEVEVVSLTQDVAVATGVATWTAGIGIGTILEWIPNDIGKLATLVGIVLSTVLIFTHLRKGRAEYNKIQLEIKLLEEKKHKGEPHIIV